MTKKMEREERRKKFHESLKQILFPSASTSTSTSPSQEINIDELLNSNPNHQIPEVFYDEDELGEVGSSSSSEDEGECGPQKPTRAQRKRVRKKKMKEDAERRNGMIGPLVAAPDGVEGVQRNTAERLNSENDRAGEAAPCAIQSKVRNRRRAKKLAKEKVDSAIAEKPQQDCDFTGNTES